MAATLMDMQVPREAPVASKVARKGHVGWGENIANQMRTFDEGMQPSWTQRDGSGIRLSRRGESWDFLPGDHARLVMVG